METVGKFSKRPKIEKSKSKVNPAYYFHSDEDFREDWDWGKRKMLASKAISKTVNKF